MFIGCLIALLTRLSEKWYKQWTGLVTECVRFSVTPAKPAIPDTPTSAVYFRRECQLSLTADFCSLAA